MAQDDVRKSVAQLRASLAEATAGDGPFPLREEEVEHFGTVQRYLCWQRGPNSLTHLTLPELYGDCFTRFSDKEFLVYEGRRLTYAAVIESAAVLARALASAYGVERGVCVAIAGRNHPNWVISLLAVTGFLSAVALPVNSWWVGEELRYGLEDSQSVLLMADAFVLKRAQFLAQMALPAVCIDGDVASLPEALRGVRSFDDVVALGRAAPSMPLRPACQDDRAMLMYTSGTTNKPKGVVLTHRGILGAINMLRLIRHSKEAKPQEVLLAGSPLFHVNGSHVALFAALSIGAKLVLMYKWSAGGALELVQRERIQTLVGVPTMTYDLVNHPDFHKFDTSSMKQVGGGGAAFSAPMIKRVADRFKTARAGTGYGLTETNAISVVMPPELFPRRPTSCGIAVTNVEVSILDEEGRHAPPGEVGEICIRGATVMKEYWRKPDKTQEVFHIDGEGKLWFRTGDIGTMDADGFVFIMDRAKDIIIRGGENISCAEVEAAIFEHPAVAEVAAIAVPHETLGEAVAVAIALTPGAPPPSDEELRRHAQERLAAFKVPAHIIRWEGFLPRGATGKIQKREIRDQVAARAGRSKL